MKKPCEGPERRRALTWSRSQFDIEGEDVTERDTGVDKATVTSGDAELSIVKSTASIYDWAESVYGGLFVVLAGLVSKSAGPVQV